MTRLVVGLAAALLATTLASPVAAPAWARQTPSNQQIRALIAAIRDGPPGARNRAVQRLYHLRDRRAGRALLALARSATPSEARWGLWALAIAKPRGAATLLKRRARRARVASVRAAAVRAAGRLRAPNAAKVAARALRDPARPVRHAAVEALSRLGQRGLRGLARARRLRDASLRLLAVVGIAAVPGPRATRLLLRGLRHGSDQERLECVRQLRRRASASARAPVTTPASSASARAAYRRARRHAERALCRLALRASAGVRLQAVGLLAHAPSSGCAEAVLRRLGAPSRRGPIAAAARRARARRAGRPAPTP